MITREHARKLRQLLIKASESLTDKEASEGVELFPKMKYDGSLISAGTRINWNTQIKKSVTDLWDYEINNPDKSPTLWESIEYKDGIRIIPKVITVTSLFSADELGWWDDVLYRSKVNNNVYTPDQYPPNWELV